MIKYLGSKRRLVPFLGELVAASGARTVLDLFSGTTRVAQECKRRGALVTAVDRTRCAHVLARCYVETDGSAVDLDEAEAALAQMAAVPPREGYVTEVFCRRARYFRPENGARIDAVRDAIEERWAGTWLWPVLLTSLLEAADRVDSTTGVQMAFLKSWAPRAANPLELRLPALLPGPGRAVRGDAVALAGRLGAFDLAYLDPPYNQHRYETNYHVWETLVAWDRPEHYGVACKRVDSRDPAGRSPFNQRRTMPGALASVIRDVQADVMVLSCNDEAWVSLDELVAMCDGRGCVEVVGFASRRYVGAQIGVHSPAGLKVGRPGRLHNVEYVVVSGSRAAVARTLGRASIRR